ncbi:pur operon repressor [Aureibacillus halotolerans]|uniref:Purine operon repressor PurR n=1 Tax=Aureibacillus halotolerans TaxID=1508390 RepID=A0A4R6TTK1_9BACI|nr:pur operon repressor [Aureibacillus halotolerans]TDQ34234.1 purine operon repressor PurR [Aureibacillus halotolerans]
MKFRRSGRLIDMTHYLLQHPRQLISLTFFADRYHAAKSSISEDLALVKSTFEEKGIGSLHTVPGASGGVKYIPMVRLDEAEAIATQLTKRLTEIDRILPGDYLYLADVLGDTPMIHQAGRLFASHFAQQPIDVVMTVATKGIPLAYAVAYHLGVPVVIVRRDSKVTEGSTVSINYVSGSTKRIQSMVLAKRSLDAGSNVLIVDDFMKAGGTINGMISMIDEFQANLAGIGVLVEAAGEGGERLVDEYVSLLRLMKVDATTKQIDVDKGTFFQLYNSSSKEETTS